MTRPINRTTYAIGVLTATSLMGASFAVGKMGLPYLAPVPLAGVRFTLAGAIMALATIGRPRPVTWSDWGIVAVIGALQTTGVMGLAFTSLHTISAGESSILIFLNPLLVVMFAALFLHRRYHWRQWLGAGLGFGGVWIALSVQMAVRSGTWLALGGAVCWAVATLLVKKYGQRFDIYVLTAYQMLFGGAALWGLAALQGSLAFSWNRTGVVIVAILVVMAVLQFLAWFWVLHVGDAAKASAFLFLAPAFGVLFGWLLLGEAVPHALLAGGLLTSLGIFLVNWPGHGQVARKAKTARSA